MKAIAIEQWDDVDHISGLVSESPTRALKLINLGISEKIKILVNKNMYIDLDESILRMNDSYFNDILNSMFQNQVIDKKQKRQLENYKMLLNSRHNEYLDSDIKGLCTDGLMILCNL